MLADPEMFWVAQAYLAIPSDFVLAVHRTPHKWYERILGARIDSRHLILSDFYELRDAIRFATRNDDYRSDLPGLLTQLRVFRGHHSVAIQRRVFYEDFVASLRGLEGGAGF